MYLKQKCIPNRDWVLGILLIEGEEEGPSARQRLDQKVIYTRYIIMSLGYDMHYPAYGGVEHARGRTTSVQERDAACFSWSISKVACLYMCTRGPHGRRHSTGS